MRINPQFKTPIENDMSRLTDTRDKNMEACIEKYLFLHNVFDKELLNQNIKKFVKICFCL